MCVHLLFDAPEPLSIASRPVAWMAATIADGAAIMDDLWVQIHHPHPPWQPALIPVPSTDTNWSSTLGSTLVMPPTLNKASETSLAQPPHVMGTAKTVCFTFQSAFSLEARTI